MSLESVLYVSPEQKSKITSERKANDVSNDLIALKEWLKKQPHLPQEIEDDLLCKMLQLNKYSLEKTKKKIDALYSCRVLAPEFFTDRNPLSKENLIFHQVMSMVPLPNLTDDLCRIYIFSFKKCDPNLYDLTQQVKFLFMINDLRLHFDTAEAEIFIVDLSHITMTHMTKISPVTMKKATTIITKAYSDRIKSIHMVNMPSYATPLLQLIQLCLTDKIIGRIQGYTSVESIYKDVPKKYLPSDYGGEQKSLEEISDKWRKFLESKSDWLIKEGNIKSNESLRIGAPLDEDFFGSVQGSFRMLSVD